MCKKAILFDIDGTLVDSNEAHLEVWRQVLADAGYRFSHAALHEHLGKGGDNYVPSLIPDATPELIDRVGQAHAELYKSDHLERVRPFPGAREILRTAAGHGQMVLLASSASREELDHYIQLLEAGDVLTATTSKDDVGHSKPCPDIFAAALERTGLPADEVIVLGDTPFDIMAARRTGIDAVGVLSGGFREEVLRDAGAIAIYDDVGQLLADYEHTPLAGVPEAADAA